VQLGTVGDRVRVAGGLPVSFWGMWCRDPEEVVGGLRKLVVEGIAGDGFGYAAEVVEVDWR
jgi:hypothetical protein